MKLRICAGAGVAVLCAGSVLGAGPASIVSVLGETDASASASFVGVPTDTDMDDATANAFTGFPIGSFADALAVTPTSSSDADLDASMMMTGTSLTVSALGEAFAEATNGSIDGSADASADADFELIFTVAGSVDWTLDYNAMVGGMNQIGNSGIRLRETGGSLLFSVDGTIDGEEDIAMGTLGPGSYTLSAFAGAGAFSGEDVPDESATALFDFEFVVVPTPGAAGLLAMGMAAAARRRRDARLPSLVGHCSRSS